MRRRRRQKNLEPVTPEELDELYRKVETDNPDLDFNAVSEEVTRLIGDRPLLTASDSSTSVPDDLYETKPSWMSRNGLAVVLLVAGILIGAALGFFLPEYLTSPDETVVESPTAEPLITTNALTRITANYGEVNTTELVPGQEIRAYLALTDEAGTPLPGQTVALLVNPPEAGHVRAESLTSDEGGLVHFTFVAGSVPGATRILASSAGMDLTPLELIVATAPSPELAVRIESPLDAGQLPPRPGEEFPVRYLIDNNGDAGASNVILYVRKPSNAEFVEGKGTLEDTARCSWNEEDIISCNFANAHSGEAVLTPTFFFVAPESGQVTLSPDDYWLTFDQGGSTRVSGSETKTVAIAAPVATTLVLDTELPELPADGTTTMGVTVEIRDQWGELLAGETAVQVTAVHSPNDTEGVAEDEITCTLEIATSIRENSCEEAGENPTLPELPSATQIRLLARPEEGCLFVELLDDSSQQGFLSLEDDPATQLACGLEDLPTELDTLPQSFSPAQGSVDPEQLTVNNGIGNFRYVSGWRPGTVTLTATITAANIADTEMVTLLEAGRFTGSEHLYVTENVTDTGIVLLFRPPPDAPLELLPVDPGVPNARRAQMRIWVPEDTIVSPDERESRIQISSATRVFFGFGPQDALNSEEEQDQQLQLAVNELGPFWLLGKIEDSEEGPLRQIILEGWVKVAHIQ